MPVFAWALGAIGAVVLIKLFNREWRRVNDELDRANPVRVSDPERAGVPTLRRDPATGEYRRRPLSVSSRSLMPCSRTTLPQRSYSSLRNLPNSAGLSATGIAPESISFCFTTGSLIALHERVVDLGDDRGRRLGRRQQAVPVVDDGVGIALLGERRHIRQHRIALAGRRAERPDLAALDVRHQHRRVGGEHLHLAAEQIGQRGRRAAIGHVDELHAGRRSATAPAPDAAVEPTPVEAKVISPGLALAAATRSFIDLNGDSARTTISVVLQHHQRDRREVLDRVVGQVVAHVRRDADRAERGEEQRGAVGLRLRHVVGADRAVGAGLVLDDDGLAEDVLDLVGDQAADEIGRAAGREGDHDVDRLVGKVLRLHGGRGRGEQQQSRGEFGKA